MGSSVSTAVHRRAVAVAFELGGTALSSLNQTKCDSHEYQTVSVSAYRRSNPDLPSPERNVRAEVSEAEKKAYAECLRNCLEDFKQDLEDARAVCMECSFSVFGWCISKTPDKECVQGITDKANEVYDACKDACGPPECEDEDEEDPDPRPRPRR